MGLSEAMLFAFAATIICAFAIAEKIIDIDFEQFMTKEFEKAKMKRILAKRETPLQGARLQKDIKDSFEMYYFHLEKQIRVIFQREWILHFAERWFIRWNCWESVSFARYPGDGRCTTSKNNFKRWNDDGREWRESILQCSSLERLISPQSGKTVHQIYRKNSYLRILQSRHIRHSDRQGKNKEFYSDKGTIICPSCGAEVELSSQQVICPYCGGVIQSEFYDWQTEVFEIYEKMGANMQYGLLLFAYSGIMFLCLTLCLYLIKDTDISLTIGVIATLLILLGIAKIFQSKEEKQEKLPKEIVRYSENYLRSCINDALYKDVNKPDLMDYGIGNITLKKVVNTEDITKIKVKVCASETYLPDRRNPYTKKVKRTLIMQRARYPERRREDGVFFMETECPSCGANFVPDENHCCSFCGYSLKSDNAKWVLIK